VSKNLSKIIIQEILQATSKWKMFANKKGIPRSEQELIDKAFKI